MFEGYGSVTQAFLGTLFTWGMTAAGAALVFVIRGISQKKLLDVSLGFAAGVMTAASYWSLLTPAIKLSEESGFYGKKGEYAFLPVAVGFLLGAVFVYATDVFLDYIGISSTNIILAMKSSSKNKVNDDDLGMDPRSSRSANDSYEPSVIAVETPSFGDCINNHHFSSTQIPNRQKTATSRSNEAVQAFEDTNVSIDGVLELRKSRWKRIVLLVVVITVHNIPEGLAIGVGFGAVGSSSTATFLAARNLAIGIGIQNFPEGLAVSLPLQAAGFSVWKSFWYGQLSGMVEPIFGVLGAVAVTAAKPILPYALALAAGAMIYVVIDDIIPEANTGANGKLATWGCIAGFLVMMCLEVGLG